MNVVYTSSEECRKTEPVSVIKHKEWMKAQKLSAINPKVEFAPLPQRLKPWLSEYGIMTLRQLERALAADCPYRSLVKYPNVGRTTRDIVERFVKSYRRRVPYNSFAAYSYPITIQAIEGEAGFVAIAGDLPGCRSDGATPEEALINGYDAISCWLEAVEEMGRAAPIPQPVPA